MYRSYVWLLLGDSRALGRGKHAFLSFMPFPSLSCPFSFARGTWCRASSGKSRAGVLRSTTLCWPTANPSLPRLAAGTPSSVGHWYNLTHQPMVRTSPVSSCTYCNVSNRTVVYCTPLCCTAWHCTDARSYSQWRPADSLKTICTHCTECSVLRCTAWYCNVLYCIAGTVHSGDQQSVWRGGDNGRAPKYRTCTVVDLTCVALRCTVLVAGPIHSGDQQAVWGPGYSERCAPGDRQY